MFGAAKEASALNAYYEKVEDAKQQVANRFLDSGLLVWERALEDVAPHISSKQLDTLRREFDNHLQLRRYERTPGSDAGSESDEDIDNVDDSREESVPSNLDDDSSAETGAIYQSEHMKLVRRRTMGPWINTRKGPSRSLTSNLGQGEAAQIPRPSLRNQKNLSHTFCDNAGNTIESSRETKIGEPIMGREPPSSRELISNLVVDESNLGTRIAPGRLLGTKE